MLLFFPSSSPFAVDDFCFLDFLASSLSTLWLLLEATEFLVGVFNSGTFLFFVPDPLATTSTLSSTFFLASSFPFSALLFSWLF